MIGLVLHHHRDEVLDLADRALAWADDNGHQIVMPNDDAELISRPALARSEAEFAAGLSMCLSIGGDGTILRANQLVADADVAVLGINAGHLGYLTEVAPEALEATLDQWQAGKLETQERMLLEVTVENGAASTHLALNEVALVSATNTHSVEVEVSIGGNPFTSYLADGVIVATPTGSTAYSLSAGGPIVEPEFEALLLTPVAPHMVFDRSLVLAPSTEVRLAIGGYRSGTVAVDGRPIAELEPGHSIVCRASHRRARFLISGDRDFHTILKEKFGLSGR